MKNRNFLVIAISICALSLIGIAFVVLTSKGMLYPLKTSGHEGTTGNETKAETDVDKVNTDTKVNEDDNSKEENSAKTDASLQTGTSESMNTMDRLYSWNQKYGNRRHIPTDSAEGIEQWLREYYPDLSEKEYSDYMQRILKEIEATRQQAMEETRAQLVGLSEAELQRVLDSMDIGYVFRTEQEYAELYECYCSYPIIKDAKSKINNIPVIDVESAQLLRIGIDQSTYKIGQADQIVIDHEKIKAAGFTGVVMREREDGTRYMIFDLQGGYRVFQYMDIEDQQKGIPMMAGYCVVYKNKLSYADFSGITVGDQISKVAEVDDTCQLVWDYINFGVERGLYQRLIDEGKAYCSVHYLTDGLLKVQYGSVGEDNVPVVTAVEYYPDYVMETFTGEKLNYKLNPLDLP